MSIRYDGQLLQFTGLDEAVVGDDELAAVRRLASIVTLIRIHSGGAALVIADGCKN